MPHVNSEFSWMTHPMYNIDVKIYYLLEDLSGDSIPELILINHEASGTDYLIVDTYQLVNGKPEKLIDDYSLANRKYCMLCENQVIRVKGSGGAEYTTIEYYKLVGIDKKLVYQVIHNGGNNYYTVDQNNVQKSITKDEFSSYFKGNLNYEPFRNNLHWVKL